MIHFLFRGYWGKACSPKSSTGYSSLLARRNVLVAKSPTMSHSQSLHQRMCHSLPVPVTF